MFHINKLALPGMLRTLRRLAFRCIKPVTAFVWLFCMGVIRLLIHVTDLELFDSLVAPFEQEAYEILKSRSRE